MPRKPKPDGPPDFSGFHTHPDEHTDGEHVVYDRDYRAVVLIPLKHLGHDEAYRLAVAITATGDMLAMLRGTLAWCPRCKGDGEFPVREYDAASNEMEESGRYEACPTCAPIRAAIRKATTSTEG